MPSATAAPIRVIHVVARVGVERPLQLWSNYSRWNKQKRMENHPRLAPRRRHPQHSWESRKVRYNGASEPHRSLLWFAVIFSDINELNLPKTCGTEFPDPDDLLSFKLIICPDEVRKPERLDINVQAMSFLSDSVENSSLTVDLVNNNICFNRSITVSGFLQRW